MEYITKPLAILVLFWFFNKSSAHLPLKLRRGILIGLILFMISDISFLLRTDISNWFLGGTYIFSLLAVYFYTRSLQYTKSTFLGTLDFKSITSINLFLSILMIVFPISIFVVEDLEAWQYPAISYQVLMWGLITQGLKRQDHVNESSYYLVLAGILLYSITTMLLTLQNFTHSTFDFKSFPVLSYFTAQFFIVFGVVVQHPVESNKKLQKIVNPQNKIM